MKKAVLLIAGLFAASACNQKATRPGKVRKGSGYIAKKGAFAKDDLSLNGKCLSLKSLTDNLKKRDDAAVFATYDLDLGSGSLDKFKSAITDDAVRANYFLSDAALRPVAKVFTDGFMDDVTIAKYFDAADQAGCHTGDKITMADGSVFTAQDTGNTYLSMVNATTGEARVYKKTDNGVRLEVFTTLLGKKACNITPVTQKQSYTLGLDAGVAFVPVKPSVLKMINGTSSAKKTDPTTRDPLIVSIVYQSLVEKITTAPACPAPAK